MCFNPSHALLSALHLRAVARLFSFLEIIPDTGQQGPQAIMVLGREAPPRPGPQFFDQGQQFGVGSLSLSA